MNDTIDFTPETVKQYLVAAVQKWRERKRELLGANGSESEVLAIMCYIDAFQSMHATLFGTLVPEENPDAQP